MRPPPKFQQGSGHRPLNFRKALEGLGYKVYDQSPYFQFVKKLPASAGPRSVKVDLHARLPVDAETERVKYKPPRVGRRAKGGQLHAYGTPEAFAVEIDAQEIPFAGVDPDGVAFQGVVRVPHPFASLCMKLQAALDHERTPPAEKKPRGPRHAFDVYLLLAMLDPDEWEGAGALRQRFAGEPALDAVRAGIAEHFARPDAAACRTIREQTRAGGSGELELDRFCASLCELFEVQGA